MTQDEIDDIKNDLAKDKRVIDCDEEYERRVARSRRTFRATRWDDDTDWDQEGDDEEEK